MQLECIRYMHLFGSASIYPFDAEEIRDHGKQYASESVVLKLGVNASQFYGKHTVV